MRHAVLVGAGLVSGGRCCLGQDRGSQYVRRPAATGNSRSLCAAALSSAAISSTSRCAACCASASVGSIPDPDRARPQAFHAHSPPLSSETSQPRATPRTTGTEATPHICKHQRSPDARLAALFSRVPGKRAWAMGNSVTRVAVKTDEERRVVTLVGWRRRLYHVALPWGSLGAFFRCEDRTTSSAERDRPRITSNKRHSGLDQPHRRMAAEAG